MRNTALSKYYIGAEFTNRSESKFTIIDKCIEPRYWKVRFETGYVTVAKEPNILYGKVKDYFLPSVYGIGYLGSSQKIPQRESGTLLRAKYDLWANMLKRCYGGYKDSWNADYNHIEVHPQWLNFCVFAQEIEEVRGYEAWLQDTTLCLDKDLSGKFLYSKNTCVFITNAENLSEAGLRRWAKMG